MAFRNQAPVITEFLSITPSKMKQPEFSSRILNLTRNCYLKLRQAEARVEARTAVWVDTRTIRELTLREILDFRAIQRESEHTFSRGIANELPGIRFEPPIADKYKYHERIPLLRQAAELLQA